MQVLLKKTIGGTNPQPAILIFKDGCAYIPVKIFISIAGNFSGQGIVMKQIKPAILACDDK